ncbi:MAG: hypothetical protein HDT28_05975 [Clostridiales bacterium]|nr:hypothetical protein [Clostridiales bacterium]
MDDKGRLRIPPTFRKLLGDNPMIFCCFGKCLYVYTGEDYEKLIERFSTADMLDDDMGDIMRAIFSSTQPLVEDKQGRVSLNSSFMEQCGLTKNVVSIGVLNHVEIWDEDEFKTHMAGIDRKKILAPFSSSRGKE